MSKPASSLLLRIRPLILTIWIFCQCSALMAAGPGETASPPLPVAPQSASVPASNGTKSMKKPATPELFWRTLTPGLELGIAELWESKRKENEAVFVLLRVDPEQHRFSLQMASEAGNAYSLADWCAKANLRAGINASMYLPDNKTSIGYMRSDEGINNAKIGGRLGGFFVAERRTKSVKPADIIELGSKDWRERLEKYAIVVQNYRLVDSEGKILWPSGGSEHSIAAIAKDHNGRIVFALSQEPLTAADFAAYLKSFSLLPEVVMYVEGGQQAGLFLRLDYSDERGKENVKLPQRLAGATVHELAGSRIFIWKGRQSFFDLRGNPEAVLPNIIGIRR